MSVYLFLAAEVRMVKIGFSNNPWTRLKVAQSNCPVELSMAAILDGGTDFEIELHRLFAKDHVRGDWYRLSPEILGFIALDPTPERPIDGRKVRWAKARSAAAQKAAA